MDFITAGNVLDHKWDKDEHGTSMAALTDDHPGLMRHVATRVAEEEDDQTKWVDFVVECANGAVNACITVQVKYSVIWHSEYISEILVKIVAAHCSRRS
jgi:hypothetical protein